jgi:hypothetical protein
LGAFVKDLVIELILVAAILVPLLASSPQPCRAVQREDSGIFRKRK